MGAEVGFTWRDEPLRGPNALPTVVGPGGVGAIVIVPDGVAESTPVGDGACWSLVEKVHGTPPLSYFVSPILI